MKTVEVNVEASSEAHVNAAALLMAQPISAADWQLLGSRGASAEPAWMPEVEQILRTITVREGVVLYDLEFVGTNLGRTLRVFIDKSEAPVGIDDCANVSRGLNEVLDQKEDLIPGAAYQLEVSSPGLERDLRRRIHFHAAVGKKIWIKLTHALGEILGEHLPVPSFALGKQITVALKQSDSEGLVVELEGHELRLPWTEVEKGQVVFSFEEEERAAGPAQKKPGKKDHKKKKKN